MTVKQISITAMAMLFVGSAIIVPPFVMVGCREPLQCETITELGECVPGDWSSYPRCVAKLSSGDIITVTAPTMVGRKVCRRGSGYWYYP